MNQPTKLHLSTTIASLIGIGIFILLFIIGFVFFSYLFIISGIIGLVLFIIAYIKAKFLLHKTRQKAGKTKKNHQAIGRTIDHR